MTTKRWNDEMLDNLAERVNDLSVSVEQTTHNVDVLVGTVNALIERDNQRALEIQQLRQESEAYRQENDQRFNTVLDEIRFLIRQLEIASN